MAACSAIGADDKGESKVNNLPEYGFLSLYQIIGNKSVNNPIPAIIPVSKSTWWAGVKSGLYPKPYKIGEKRVAWKVSEIKNFIDSVEPSEGGDIFSE